MTRPSEIAQPDMTPAPPPGPVAGTDSFLRGFVGSAVLVLAIDLSEGLLFGDGYFAGLTWHPFWIVILLATVQHGLFVGLPIVGLATMMMDWPTRPVGVDITEHYGLIATVPAQWLAIALLIGVYRQQQLTRERAIARECARLREVNLVLAGEIHRLDAFVARTELAAATRAPLDATPDADADADRIAAPLGDPVDPLRVAVSPPEDHGTVLSLVPDDGGGDRDQPDAGGGGPLPEDTRLPEDHAALPRPGRAVHG